MTWTYRQSTGQLYRDGNLITLGYSGNRQGKNNPAMQENIAVGPIPRGKWRIGPAYQHKRLGPCTMNLLPIDGTETFGRSAFRIHGDSRSAPGDASHGCIILGPQFRHRINDSSDKILEVVA